MHVYSFNDLKFTLKRSYIFRSYDHPQHVLCIVYCVSRILFRMATALAQRNEVNH